MTRPINYRIGQSCFTCLYREFHPEIDKCFLHDYFITNIGVCDDWVEDPEWKKKNANKPKLIPVRYILTTDRHGNDIFMDRMIGGDVERWAIRDNFGYCFNKNIEWEEEPQPSNRDDDFLVRCRWDALEEAYDFWIKNA
jgi:hypothetical protein